MPPVEIHTYEDFTVRIYGAACAVLSWRDGRRRAVDGPLAQVLVSIVNQVGLKCVKKYSGTFAREADSQSIRQVAEALALLIAGPPTGETVDLNGLLSQAPSLLNYVTQSRLPLYGMMELTYLCNLRCRHCYVLHKVEEKHPAHLSDSAITKTIDSLVDLGCLYVTITGGEPTLAQNYRSYISMCKDRSLYTTLKTNATTFTKTRAQKYAQDPAHETHVSIYGASSATHDYFTAIQGSLHRTLEGMRNLAACGIRCKVNCTVWKGNVNELDGIRKLVEDNGHYVVFDDIIHGRLNGDMFPLNLAIEQDERTRLVAAGILDSFKPAPCTAGAVKVKVDAEGRVGTCELLARSFGNVNQRPLADIWASPELVGFGETAMQISKERRLSGDLDRACPGLNILKTGTLEGESTHPKTLIKANFRSLSRYRVTSQ
jgi:MoaA/NifB/PqqE/SkfB family radical SAM enzyme